MRIKGLFLAISFLALGYLAGGYDFSTEKISIEVDTPSIEEPVLQIIHPVTCSSSSKEANLSCENLSNYSLLGWTSSSMGCDNQWLEFEFDKETFVAFLVIEEYGDTEILSLEEIEITTSSSTYRETLSDLEDSHWVDIQSVTDKVRIDFVSTYDSNVSLCGLLQVDFFGT